MMLVPMKYSVYIAVAYLILQVPWCKLIVLQLGTQDADAQIISWKRPLGPSWEVHSGLSGHPVMLRGSHARGTKYCMRPLQLQLSSRSQVVVNSAEATRTQLWTDGGSITSRSMDGLSGYISRSEVFAWQLVFRALGIVPYGGNFCMSNGMHRADSSQPFQFIPSQHITLIALN
jgi:hypothetical protein